MTRIVLCCFSLEGVWSRRTIRNHGITFRLAFLGGIHRFFSLFLFLAYGWNRLLLGRGLYALFYRFLLRRSGIFLLFLPLDRSRRFLGRQHRILFYSRLVWRSDVFLLLCIDRWRYDRNFLDCCYLSGLRCFRRCGGWRRFGSNLGWVLAVETAFQSGSSRRHRRQFHGHEWYGCRRRAGRGRQRSRFPCH